MITLVLLGNKLLLGMDETPVKTASYAVQKSNVFSGMYSFGILGAMMTGQELAEVAAGDYMGSLIIKVGLARGGMLRLTPSAAEKAAELAADLIRRA